MIKDPQNQKDVSSKIKDFQTVYQLFLTLERALNEVQERETHYFVQVARTAFEDAVYWKMIAEEKV